jgi:hypothetical protein
MESRALLPLRNKKMNLIKPNAASPWIVMSFLDRDERAIRNYFNDLGFGDVSFTLRLREWTRAPRSKGCNEIEYNSVASRQLCRPQKSEQARIRDPTTSQILACRRRTLHHWQVLPPPWPQIAKTTCPSRPWLSIGHTILMVGPRSLYGRPSSCSYGRDENHEVRS